MDKIISAQSQDTASVGSCYPNAPMNTELCLTDPGLNDYRLNILDSLSNSAKLGYCVPHVFNVAGKALILQLQFMLV